MGILNNIATTFSEIRELTTIHKGFHECSEELYFRAYGEMPVNFLPNGTWQMGEEYSNGLFYTFYTKGGKYFSCLCNKNFAINHINREELV